MRSENSVQHLAIFPRSHIPALDGLRGWAILLVLLTHIAAPLRWSTPLLVISSYGWVGVDLFFALSGFLITGILIDSKPRTGYLKNFYARRILRIWPIYFLLLALVFLVTTHLGPAFQFPRSYYRWEYYVFYLQNLWLKDFGPAPLQMTWSLAVEEQFYLLWPLVVLVTSASRLKRILIGLVVVAPLLRLEVVLSGGDDFTLYTHTFCRLDGLVMGALLAVWTRSPSFSWEKLQRMGKAGLIAGTPLTVAAFYFIAAAGSHKLQRIGFALALWPLALAFTSCLALTLRGSERRGRFTFLSDNALFRRLGKISYGLYIFHPLIFLIFVNSGVYRWLVTWRHNGVADVVAAVFQLLLAYTVASLSWTFIETPILRLKRSFQSRAGEDSSVQSGAGPEIISATAGH